MKNNFNLRQPDAHDWLQLGLAVVCAVSLLAFVVIGWVSVWGKPINFQIFSFVPWYGWIFLVSVIVCMLIHEKMKNRRRET